MIKEKWTLEIRDSSWSRKWNERDYKILQYLLNSLDKKRYRRYTAKVSYKTLRKIINTGGIRETRAYVKKNYDKLFNLRFIIYYPERNSWFHNAIGSVTIYKSKIQIIFSPNFVDNAWWLLPYLRMHSDKDEMWNYKGSIFTGQALDGHRSYLKGYDIKIIAPPKKYRIKYIVQNGGKMLNANNT